MKKLKIQIEKFIIFMLSIAIFIVLSCIIIVNLTKDNTTIITEKPKVIPAINIDNYQEYFKYSGVLVNSNLINNRFLSLLYKDKDRLVSHLIDFDTSKEISYESLIRIKKKDLFYEKINELLKLKYPSSVIQLLKTSKTNYFFDEKELNLYYDIPSEINTKKEFSLKVDYNEIMDYLTFKPLLNETYSNEDGYNYDPNKVSVAFTFDDGPSGEKTSRLIDALEDYKMSATFFMVGYKLEKYPDVVKKVNDSHSEVGYHSYSHTRFTKQTKKEIIDDFSSADNIFNKITGNHLKLTRPPYGSYNQEVLDSLDTAFIRWNIDTNDWQYHDVEYLVNYVMENYKNHAIILFHDTYDTSVEAAIKLMEKLYYEDVQVLSVTELSKLLGIPLEKHQAYYSFD